MLNNVPIYQCANMPISCAAAYCMAIGTLAYWHISTLFYWHISACQTDSVTPIPGKSLSVILPFNTSTPLKRSLEISKLPSKSAKSTAGENCAAADMAQDVSVIHPTITFISSARAKVTIFHASRIPVHFISFILIPVKAPFKAATSLRRCKDSSANTGNGLC